MKNGPRRAELTHQVPASGITVQRVQRYEGSCLVRRLTGEVVIEDARVAISDDRSAYRAFVPWHGEIELPDLSQALAQ